MARFAVLEQFSGRNLGDTASLSQIINQIKEVDPSARFDIYSVLMPSLRKFFPEQYTCMKRIDMMPWNFTLNFIGLPVLIHIPCCDLVLIRGGVFFDKMIHNPLYSYLLNFLFVVPYVKLCKKPMCLFGVGIGPLHTKFGRRAVRYICNQATIITTRDHQSLELLRELGVVKPTVALGADPAILLKPISESHAKKVCFSQNVDTKKPLIGVNVCGFIDLMVKRKSDRGLKKRAFASIIIETLSMVIHELNVNIVLIPTDSEGDIYNVIFSGFSDRRRIYRIDKTKCTPEEISGVIRICDLFVGMRMHSLIFSAVAGTPMLGICYSPKVQELMRELGRPAAIVSMNNFNRDILYETILREWHDRNRSKETLISNVEGLKRRERVTINLISDMLF